MIFFTMLGVPAAHSSQFPGVKSNSLLGQLLSDVELTTRLKTQFDDNIFLTENNEDSDIHQIYSQGIKYKKSQGKHFVGLDYLLNYNHYIEETTDVLTHSANFLYSYRPFKKLSFAFGDNYYWLGDSSITTSLGDRILALGYSQNTPKAQLKYELDPRTILTTDFSHQTLNVRDPANDDFIDNQRINGAAKINYTLNPDQQIEVYAGYGYDQIDFTHITEKDAMTSRGFMGLVKKVPGFFSITPEINFVHIDMENLNNTDDNNIDYRVALESLFSLYTKVIFSYQYQVKNPSLRREYTQYAADIAAFRLTHTLNPKTLLVGGYSYERQDFNSSDALVGQPQEDKQTHVHGINLGLNRKLNDWLTLELSYDYTKRDTDFTAEGYTNNQYGIAFTARY